MNDDGSPFGGFAHDTPQDTMAEWEDVRRWFVQAPSWVPYAVASSAAAVVLLCLVCICRRVCCRRTQSNYEAITRDLDDEEREFELGLSSDDDDGLDVGFNDNELKQMEMLESYGVQTTDEITPEANVPPLSPSAATTSMRSKKVLDDN